MSILLFIDKRYTQPQSYNMANMAKYKFTNMEDVLKSINNKYISFSETEEKKNNRILASVRLIVNKHMAAVDPLFAVMFHEIFYGGSFYDELKIGKPDEFDLDLLLKIEDFANISLTPSNIPGFVHLKATENDSTPQELKKLLNKDGYIHTDSICKWMQSVVQRAINRFTNGSNIFTTEFDGSFKIELHEGGPAMTLHIINTGFNYFYEEHDDIPDRNLVMKIDLVPCFEFDGSKWPQNGFIKNPTQKPNFFIVPKKPKSSLTQPLGRYWRLSFQEQERELMYNKPRLNSTIKLLKKLRNTHRHDCIASYYIKTAVLHIDKTKNDAFWQMSLSHVFMTVLKEYKEFIRARNIPYYWYKKEKYNLIDRPKDITLANFANMLERMINDIERNPDKPERVAYYLLPHPTYDSFLQSNLICEELVAGSEQSQCVVI